MNVLTISTDSLGTDNPLDWGEWKMVSFSRRHANFGDPYDYLQPPNKFGEVDAVDIGLRRKLERKTAFILSHYGHGPGCSIWGLLGGVPQCTFDSTRIAGLLIWEGKPNDLGKTLEAREDCARSAIAEFTSWCNGEVYHYVLKDESKDEVIDSCGGIIGYKHLEQIVKDDLFGNDNITIDRIEGDAAWAVENLRAA